MVLAMPGSVDFGGVKGSAEHWAGGQESAIDETNRKGAAPSIKSLLEVLVTTGVVFSLEGN